MSMKSFHIITFGCQMNEHDSERMTGILEEQGFTSSSLAETCGHGHPEHVQYP